MNEHKYIEMMLDGYEGRFVKMGRFTIFKFIFFMIPKLNLLYFLNISKISN